MKLVKIDPSEDIRKQLGEWIDYCSSLNKHAIESLNPGAIGKGESPKYSLGDILRYQKISPEEIDEAIKL